MKLCHYVFNCFQQSISQILPEQTNIYLFKYIFLISEGLSLHPLDSLKPFCFLRGDAFCIKLLPVPHLPLISIFYPGPLFISVLLSRFSSDSAAVCNTDACVYPSNTTGSASVRGNSHFQGCPPLPLHRAFHLLSQAPGLTLPFLQQLPFRLQG